MTAADAHDHLVSGVDALEALYAKPAGASLIKEIDHVDANYRRFIEVAPFVVLATSGPGGLDCSPRGDGPGFVRIHDAKTLLIPDRRGNNRLDSLRNIIGDPRVALLFLIPGVSETLRVNGRAQISISPTLIGSFEVNGKPPRCVVAVHVESVYFQCSRAILRARLWDPARRVDRKDLPSTGTILADLSGHEFGGETYDREFSERVGATLY